MARPTIDATRSMIRTLEDAANHGLALPIIATADEWGKVHFHLDDVDDLNEWAEWLGHPVEVKLHDDRPQHWVETTYDERALTVVAVGLKPTAVPA